MPPRARRLVAPLATGAVALAALGVVAAVDPGAPGNPYLPCPFQLLLGLDCPGCGMTRATHALLHGDVVTALDHNALSVAAWLVALAAWSAWAVRAWREPGAPSPLARLAPAPRTRSAVMVAALAVVLAFGVVRNLVPWLGSGAGA